MSPSLMSANPLVFVPAGELNLTGLETPKMIESNPEVMAY